MRNDEISKLRTVVEDHEKRIQELEGAIKKREPQITYGRADVEGIEKLVKKTGVNKAKINGIFDLEENQLTVVKTLGEKDKDKTQNTTLLVLVGYKYLLGKDKILSQEIRRNVAENNIALNNFSTYINEISPSLIRRKGKLRSPKTVYKLTPLGETRARELIKKVCGMKDI